MVLGKAASLSSCVETNDESYIKSSVVLARLPGEGH